jgi:LysM repeat protein
MRRGTIITTTLILAAIMVSACQQPYSTPPAATNTPLDTTSLFSTPMGTADSMKDVENFITQTAVAGGVPAIATATLAVSNPDGATTSPTPLVNIIPSATASQAVAASTPVPSGPKPGTYTLKNGEFPYCIARRFNVDPDQLLASSGLTSAQADNLSAGTVLTIPQSGAFPGDRSWHNHPATFTVGVTYDTNTVYGVACYYGDIDPATVAQNNGISVDATLTAGQVLNIP